MNKKENSIDKKTVKSKRRMNKTPQQREREVMRKLVKQKGSYRAKKRKAAILQALHNVGEYTLLMKKVFTKPDRWSMFLRQLVDEIVKIGISSIWIVMIISFFIGAVITIQLAINMSSPLIPPFTIGYATREIVLLEFSSSIMCLILAGKVGSSIASELGTMRVTEQIDALEMMGINSANFLILPKISAFLVFVPVLAIISMTIAIIGGFIATYVTPDLTATDFEYGMKLFFTPYNILNSILKNLVYAFIISSGSCYFGYTVKGGALAVGRMSTNAVVTSSVLILLADLLLTNLLLL